MNKYKVVIMYHTNVEVEVEAENPTEATDLATEKALDWEYDSQLLDNLEYEDSDVICLGPAEPKVMTPLEQMVQYVKENVMDFNNRMLSAKYKHPNWPLHRADRKLYFDINRAMVKWAMDGTMTDDEFDALDIDEIFKF